MMASRRAQKALLLLLTAAWLQPCRCSEGACLPLADDLHSRMLRLQGLAEDTLGRLTNIIEEATASSAAPSSARTPTESPSKAPPLPHPPHPDGEEYDFSYGEPGYDYDGVWPSAPDDAAGDAGGGTTRPRGETASSDGARTGSDGGATTPNGQEALSQTGSSSNEETAVSGQQAATPQSVSTTSTTAMSREDWITYAENYHRRYNLHQPVYDESYEYYEDYYDEYSGDYLDDSYYDNYESYDHPTY